MSHMVFEDLVRPWEAKRHPLKLFFYGMAFAVLAILFSLWIFPEQASLVMVFLIVIMTTPLMYFTLREEEEEDFVSDNELWLLSEHGKAIKFLLYLFFGFLVTFSLVYIFAPESLVQQLFGFQLKTIENINNVVSGKVVALDAFSSILTNNLKVLFFCLMFAIFFGAGAIFILAWNASVISAAVGTYVRNGLAKSAALAGFGSVAVHFNLFVAGLFRYMLHGIFEIAAYFIAGLAGGIISMAIVNKSVRLIKLKRVIKDSAFLIAIAIVLLVIGAVVEVFVTPAIFS